MRPMLTATSEHEDGEIDPYVHGERAEQDEDGAAARPGRRDEKKKELAQMRERLAMR